MAHERAALSSILILLFCALAWQAWTVGVTVDEPSHILSAYLFWRGQDNLKPQDMPPVLKIVSGWAAFAAGLQIPPADHPVWKTGHEWGVSAVMMENMPPAQIQRVFFWARVPMIIFPLLTAWLIWKWSRELWGAATGVILALLYAIEPTAMAHGSLVKNDIAATFGYLLFWYCAWRFWHRPGPWTAAALAGGALMGMLAKLSMLILPIIGVGVVLARRRRVLVCLAVLVLVVYCGVLAAYRFDVRQIPRDEIIAIFPSPALQYAFAPFQLLPLPANLWDGFVSLYHSNASGAPTYLLGEPRPEGDWRYFIVGILLKSPIPLQILLLIALVIGRRHLLWLLPGVLYIMLASASRLQLGVRLVLPALPFALLFAGPAVLFLSKGRQRLALAAIVAGMIFESAAIYPRGLAYVNGWGGGPENALPYFANSNLDWGQSLGDLRAYMRHNGIKHVRLAYFGNDQPARYLRQDEFESIAAPWGDPAPYVDGMLLKPKSGYYAVSVNLLPGHFFAPRYRDYFSPLKPYGPIAKPGYSIYIYRVP